MKMKPIPIKNYKPDGFIGKYQGLIKETVIPYQYEVMCDSLPDKEKSHVVKNFINAGKVLKGEDKDDGFYGMVFQDSDAAKWLEAVAYSLAVFPDKGLEDTADRLIDIICDAQDEDGYLNTYYTIKDKDKRWTNLLEGHELYCSGHMIEAAVAYYEATGKDKLLRAMEKNAQHIYEVFITNSHEGYPGHPEIELALIRLYEATENEKYLNLSKHFIDIRGVDPHYFEKERQGRSWTVWNGDGKNHEYQQSAAPVREQKDAVGHSVRAVYLYSAMAALAAKTNDIELKKACDSLYHSIIDRRMYVTGGIGSTVHGEAFTVDYDLPGDTAYAETCASIGLMFFMSRLLQNDIKGEYADIMERAFYNTVLAGMALDGKSFFYVNPLEVIPGISGKAVTHRHALPQRPGWYACACCPPNVARLISSFGKYAYGEDESTAYCHMFAAGEVAFQNGVKIKCETAYPYSFTVKYNIIKGGSLAIRLPRWSDSSSFTLCGRVREEKRENGYAYFAAEDGAEIILHLDDKAKFIYPSAKIPTLSSQVAVERGPLVYCFEGRDNEGDVLSLSLNDKGSVTADWVDSLGGTTVLTLCGKRQEKSESLYTYKKPKEVDVSIKAIPYYLWGNRGENEMRVWLPRNEK